MRRTAILLSLVPCCILLAACGKGGYTARSASSAASSSSSSTTTTTGSTGPPGAPRKVGPPTHAQALAFARAVNLTAADVPGFTPSAKHHDESPDEQRLEQKLQSCAGAGAGVGARAPRHERNTLVEVSSPDFSLKRGFLALTVSSEVSVAHTPAQAAGMLSAIRSPRVRACFTRYLSSLLKAQGRLGASVVAVKIDAGKPPAHGTTGGFAWRIIATFAIRGVHLSFYLDILGFVYGPAQVTMTSTGTVRPFPGRAQEQLYSKLLARAREYRL